MGFEHSPRDGGGEQSIVVVRKPKDQFTARREMEQVLAERHERPRNVTHAFAEMLEAANKENSSETELREAVRVISEAWHAGWLELIGPACQRA